MQDKVEVLAWLSAVLLNPRDSWGGFLNLYTLNKPFVGVDGISRGN